MFDVITPPGDQAGKNFSLPPGDGLLWQGEGFAAAWWPAAAGGAVTTQTLQKVSSINQSEYALTTTLPTDDTTPLVSEGTEIFSESFTPTSADSLIVVKVYAQFDGSTTINAACALFEDSTAIGGGYRHIKSLSYNAAGFFVGTVTAGSTSARTYSVRMGPNTGTLYLNRDAQGTKGLGGAEGTLLEIEERGTGTSVIRGRHFETDASEYSISTRLPGDDTLPDAAEGQQIFSQSYTPTASDSIILVKAKLNFDFPGSAFPVAAAVFKGSTCVGGGLLVGDTDQNDQLVIAYREVAGSTSARTYSIRVGPANASQTANLNGDNSASTGLNGSEILSFEIEEAAA